MPLSEIERGRGGKGKGIKVPPIFFTKAYGPFTNSGTCVWMLYHPLVYLNISVTLLHNTYLLMYPFQSLKGNNDPACVSIVSVNCNCSCKWYTLGEHIQIPPFPPLNNNKIATTPFEAPPTAFHGLKEKKKLFKSHRKKKKNKNNFFLSSCFGRRENVHFFLFPFSPSFSLPLSFPFSFSFYSTLFSHFHLFPLICHSFNFPRLCNKVTSAFSFSAPLAQFPPPSHSYIPTNIQGQTTVFYRKSWHSFNWPFLIL